MCKWPRKVLMMDNLPVELIYFILSELPLIDLFKCKLINRRFLNLVNNYYLTNLIVTKTSLPLTERSFDASEKINHLNLIKKHDLFCDQLEDQMFTKLKQLSFYDYKIQSHLIEKINSLQNLEVLTILKLQLIGDCQLNLPKLKALNLHLTIQKTNYGLIRLDLPKLNRLKFNLIEFAQIRYSDRLKCTY